MSPGLLVGYGLLGLALRAATGTTTATTADWGASAATPTATTVVIPLRRTTTTTCRCRSGAGDNRGALDAVEVRLVILVKFLDTVFLFKVVSAFNEDGALV